MIVPSMKGKLGTSFPKPFRRFWHEEQYAQLQRWQPLNTLRFRSRHNDYEIGCELRVAIQQRHIGSLLLAFCGV